MATDQSGANAAIAAGVTALGNYAVQAASNKRQFKYQKQAMAIQQQNNKELWDYQNAYNTPQAQMERLHAAGLNPRLIYGSGGANTGNAGSITPTEVPYQQAAQGEVPDAMLRYFQIRQMDAQYKATTQNIENAKTRAALMETEIGLKNLGLMRESIRAKNYKDLAQAEKDTAQFVALRSGELFQNERTKGTLMDQLGEMRGKQMESIDLDNTFKKYRNRLSELGIHTTDHPAFRILIQASHRTGIDLGELLSKGINQLLPYLK